MVVRDAERDKLFTAASTAAFVTVTRPPRRLFGRDGNFGGRRFLLSKWLCRDGMSRTPALEPLLSQAREEEPSRRLEREAEHQVRDEAT
jgi:hypothetical protein